ncbi:MAG: hypothetical protein JO284_05920 [Planctomycetaceae bacterium]|nr:hypothetical protein [Planctomycetaceae bacterium]
MRSTVDSSSRSPAILGKSFTAASAKLAPVPARVTTSSAPGVNLRAENPNAASTGTWPW